MPMGAPSTSALAITDARSSPGLALRSSVIAWKYSKKSSIVRRRAERRPGGGQPPSVVALDLEHVIVLGDGPEGVEARSLDAMHGRVAAEHGARFIEEGFVGVRRRIRECQSRLDGVQGRE